ncbi:MAG: thiamine biosynthesis protein [Desulfuromonadales bacterium]|nr:thiamine biosynthesis protein [Desulfuromonadales bacterium]MDW7758637.1 thiamine biosynthesis protein [Desulfuromonadales bacterium]
MSKGLGLISGGLDSILAAMVLKRQGVDVTGIVFVTPFFGSEKAEKAAAQIGIPLLIRDIGDIHLEMLKNPKYGYGRNMNPCIDCHAMMFRLAGRIMNDEGYDFLFSGEVLGQRPMSQNLSALKAVANYSDFPNRILRPLSAKLLPITPMEEQGLVDRERLLDIQGRTRRRQEELAREWKLVEYPGSGGGCLLTEKSFAGRLRDLFEHHPQASVIDVEYLKLGRQYRLSDRAKLTLGRDKVSNEALKSLLRPEDILLRTLNFSGPLGVVTGDATPADLTTAAAILASYGKGKDEPHLEVLLRQGEQSWTVEVSPMPRERVADYIL